MIIAAVDIDNHYLSFRSMAFVIWGFFSVSKKHSAYGSRTSFSQTCFSWNRTGNEKINGCIIRNPWQSGASPAI